MPLIPLANVEINDVDGPLALKRLRDRAIGCEIPEFEVRAPPVEQLVAFQYIGTRYHHLVVVITMSIGMGIIIIVVVVKVGRRWVLSMVDAGGQGGRYVGRQALGGISVDGRRLLEGRENG